MTPRRRLSEREKLYFFAFLFPLLWPLGLAMALSDLASCAAGKVRGSWRRLFGRK